MKHEKRKKKKAKEDGEEAAKIKAQTYDLLDRLFSYLGVSSNTEQALLTQESLNMFSEGPITLSSRSTAGTTERLPGPLSAEEKEEISSRTSRDTPRSRVVKEQTPELLPVTCGYFGNIVRQLLMKQRSTMLKYLLYETKGATYDKLLNYIHHHSLSELLVEMMQIKIEGYGDEPTPQDLEDCSDSD